jgi:Zn-finger nucleic acid-binding protein
MILDEPVECPRCGKLTSVVDELRYGDRVVLRLCTLCAGKPLDTLLAEFRRLVCGISAAVDRHCAACSGQGWRSMSGGRGLRVQVCPKCVGTGVDMAALLDVLEIQEKARPAKRAPPDGLTPGGSARDKMHKGE